MLSKCNPANTANCGRIPVVASAFVPLEEPALEEYLAALLYSPEWDSPASADQFAAVLDQLREAFA